MESEYLSIEDANKIANYDRLLENFNKLQAKYNEEHSNLLNFQKMLKEREKNYLRTNSEKNKRIKELEEENRSLKYKQTDIFGG